MATAIAIGAGVTIAALAGRAAIRAMKQSGIGQLSSSKYLRGGFEQQMSTREAFQILGLKESSTTKDIKKAHRTLMLQNHPDRGGSPFLASKVNEAKELLDKKK
jgi:DnaJ family protein C protein 19